MEINVFVLLEMYLSKVYVSHVRQMLMEIQQEMDVYVKCQIRYLI